MDSKLYVGNLPYSIHDDSLRQKFEAFGSVISAKVMMERDSDRSKGFGFVEMSSKQEAEAAIEGLNGKPAEGREMTVSFARPSPSRAAGHFSDKRNY